MNILHKLGLYRASEVKDLIAKANNLAAKASGVIDEAHDNADCYKTALRMFNEAQTVEHAVRVVKHYCDTADCTECRFDKGGECMFAHTAPFAWEVSK